MADMPTMGTWPPNLDVRDETYLRALYIPPGLREAAELTYRFWDLDPVPAKPRSK